MNPTSSLSRRAALRLGAGAALLAPAFALGATPRQMQGPYYPNPDQLALRPGALRDNDLTEVPGASAPARGERMVITGAVSEAGGRPVADAIVEIWQACASGRYLAARDRRRSRAHDPGFQYFGVCPVDAEGRFDFRTIVPPSYPSGALPGWIRPPHVHVRVVVPGQPDFITQLYWDDPRDPLGEENRALQRRDLLLAGVAPARRDLLIRPMDAHRRLDFPIRLAQDLYLP